MSVFADRTPYATAPVGGDAMKLSCSPDGRLLVLVHFTDKWQHELRAFRVTPALAAPLEPVGGRVRPEGLVPPSALLTSVSVDNDGTLVATVEAGPSAHSVALASVWGGAPRTRHVAVPRCCHARVRNGLVAVAASTGAVLALDAATGKVVTRMTLGAGRGGGGGAHGARAHGGNTRCEFLDDDHVAVVRAPSEVQVLHARTGVWVRTVRTSADGDFRGRHHWGLLSDGNTWTILEEDPHGQGWRCQFPVPLAHGTSVCGAPVAGAVIDAAFAPGVGVVTLTGAGLVVYGRGVETAQGMTATRVAWLTAVARAPHPRGGALVAHPRGGERKRVCTGAPFPVPAEEVFMDRRTRRMRGRWAL